MHDTDVLILGGGLSGLAVAWALARRGIRCTLWEADGQPGGKVRTHREGGWTTERAAALLLNFRPEVDALIREAGLDGDKRLRDPQRHGQRYLAHGGRLCAVPTRPLALLRSGLFSTAARLRLACEPFIPRRAIPGESVAAFVTRRLGREMLESAIDPFVAGTLAADPETAEALTTLPRLTALERRFGSLTAGMLIHRLLRRRTAQGAEVFSFAGGMGQLVAALAAAPCLTLRTGWRALALEPTRTGWRATAATADSERQCQARQVVLCTPASAAAGLLAGLDDALAARLAAIRYAPLAVVHLGLPREAIAHPLDGAGFLAPRRAGLNLNGNLWLGSLFPDRAPAGRTLLTSYLGGARHPARADWSDARLADAVLADLRPLLGVTGDPEYLRIDRHPQALPLYEGHYSAHLAEIDERLQRWPGLHLAANYRGGVAVRDRIVQGVATAERVTAALHRTESQAHSPLAPAWAGP